MIRFPFPDMQQLNLDWIMSKLRGLLAFIPQNGAVGQILRRTASGAEWSDESSGAVDSVNGQTGTVVLTAADVGALADTYVPPVVSVNSHVGSVVLDASDVGALPDTYVPPYYYAECNTAAATQVKQISIAAVTALTAGLTVRIKFTDHNTAANPQLQINSLAAVPLYQYGTTAISSTDATNGWYAGAVVQFTYDGTGFIRDQGFNTNTTYTLTQVVCTTAAATAAKTASGTYFTLSNNQVFDLVFRYANSKASAITLNINSTGAKPLYIDGVASSATNYAFGAGHYIARYDKTEDRFYINTDGSIPVNISGSAAGSVASDRFICMASAPNTDYYILCERPSRFLLMIASGAANTRGLYIVNNGTGGSVTYDAILLASTVTVDTSLTDQFKFTPANNGSFGVLVFSGSVTVLSY